MKKRLIWMIDGLGPGGAERLMPAIIENINTEKFEQRVCTLQNRNGNIIGKKLAARGVTVDYLSIPNLRHPNNLPKVLRYLRQHRPDILHTQLMFSNILGCFSANLLGFPSISTLHTLDTPKRRSSSSLRYQLMWKSLRYFANKVIAVSESTRQHNIRAGGLPADKIITMYNGINLLPFSPERFPDSDALKASLDIPEKSRILVSVAVLREAKGIQYMLKAMPVILKKIPDAYYLIIGDGDYAKELHALAVSLDIEKYVRFAGFQINIAPLLALGEIFVHPTLDDALPTVLIEAMAAEKPIVASNVGGVPEIVQDEINGILIPPADSVRLTETCLNLLVNPSKSRKMAKAGREIAEKKFSIKEQVKNLEKLYEEILSNHG